MKVLIVVTSISVYANGNLATGLWLSEFTHFYHEAKEQGYEITVASPKGGHTPIDPVSLQPLFLDKLSKTCLADDEFKRILKNTKTLHEVSMQLFDSVFLTGGHGTMYDFPNNGTLQAIIRDHYEHGKIVSAVCHGVGGLLNVRLSNGEYLLNDKEVTGYDWFEEILAGRQKVVPFNLEKELKARGSNYKKAFIPMTSNVCEDGNLNTGQNPFSSKAIAKKLVQRLSLQAG